MRVAYFWMMIKKIELFFLMHLVIFTFKDIMKLILNSKPDYICHRRPSNWIRFKIFHFV